MNIRDFDYLIAIDELKSFSAAANKRFVSQPALSQQIAKIEDQLGYQIFERDRKAMITTKKGEEVIKNAKLITHYYKEIKKIGKEQSEIRIALIPTICPYLLPLVVENLNQELPHIKFYFLELKTDDIIKKLKSGEIDLGILAYFPNLFDDKLLYSKLYDEEFLLALPKNSHLTQKDFPEIIAQKQLILLEEGNCMSENVKDICNLYSQNSFSDFYATNIETVKNMIKINNGAALLPKLSCQKEEKLKILAFNPKKFREIGIVSRKSYAFKEQLINIEKVFSNVTQAFTI
jgi:LysR family hydrogen peroxide-inducible transcriptional activator